MKAVEGSLRRLGTDYIDLYQFNWPTPAIPAAETMSALTKLVDQGKIRFVGVSNFTTDEFDEAQSFFDRGRIVSNQLGYNLYHRSIEDDFIPFSENNQITVIAYSPFNEGNLPLNRDKVQFLDNLSQKYNVTNFQIILNWIISHPTLVTIPNTTSFRHAMDNAAAADFNLLEGDIEAINRMFTQEPVLVQTDRIRVIDYDVDDTHPIYTTLEDAIENRHNMHPSPVDLAKDITNGNLLKPVELIPTTDTSGRYDYDLIHGRVRFWAWVIAYKGEKPIPAMIQELRISK
jgi:diketogulonate reductase-like aldo/keto reductase